MIGNHVFFNSFFCAFPSVYLRIWILPSETLKLLFFNRLNIKEPEERMFTMKKWNAVAMWSWDVECDTCAICRNYLNS